MRLTHQFTKKRPRGWLKAVGVLAVAALLPLSSPLALADEVEDPPVATESLDEEVADPEPVVPPTEDPEEIDQPRPAPLAADSAETEVPASEMSVAAFSSEMPGYPSPTDADGTARAVLTDNMTDTWSVEYTVVEGAGVAVNPFPHWIVLDLGQSRDLTSLIYNVKNTQANPKDVEVYVSSNPDVVDDPTNMSLWGAPVGVGTLENVANSPQTISFDDTAAGQYVMFYATSGYNANNNMQVSTLRLTEIASGGPTDPPPAGDVTLVPLTAGGMTVNVAEEFPQIASYVFADDSLGRDVGLVMQGNDTALSKFNINGADATVTSEFTQLGASKGQWVSTVAEGGFAGLTIESTIEVLDGGVAKFRIEDIQGPGALTITQISIPDHGLLSVDSSQSGAYLARTLIWTNPEQQGDSYIPISTTTPVDAAPVHTPYGFVWNDELSGGLYSNATPDKNYPWTDAKNTNPDSFTNRRLSSQVTVAGDAKVASLQSGAWVWAPSYSSTPCNTAWLFPGNDDLPPQTLDQMCKGQDPALQIYQNPETTIVIAETLANDRGQGWQSGAVKLRDTLVAPAGSERVPERVVQRIPFNFGSEATNPFLKTLDNTKRVSQATDGLGQWVLLKGYGSEGHDSANTDYAGNYNDRAGGLEQMNELIESGTEYNADFGVHVNATEAYPQARSFNDWMTDGAAGKGWGWLNQSYGINQRKDIGSGDLFQRFQDLRAEVPELATIYLDVWYSSGWLPEVVGKRLQEMGFQVGSEWSFAYEGDSIWSHWANDRNYGAAAKNKGINSNMVRFMFNSQRDVWNPDPLFDSVDMKDFEGWTGQNSWSTFIGSVWQSNFPVKYLQHFPMLDWQPGVSATLEGGVEIKMEGGSRVITQGGKEVLRGDSYLLPWSSELDADRTSNPLNADKMYFYSKSGGTRTFGLTDAFTGTTFLQYPLSSDGRGEPIPVVASGDGTLTLTGDPQTAYVVVPASDTELPFPAIDWGEFSGVSDPGFDASGDDALAAWNPTGTVTREFLFAKNEAANGGDPVAVFGSGESSISQTITGLEPGEDYALTSLVEIMGSQQRDFSWSVTGEGVSKVNAFNITPAINYVGAEPKHGTLMQRGGVQFTAPANGTVVIKAWAAAGDAPVRLDDVRVQKLESLTHVHHFWSEQPPADAPPSETGENGGVLLGLDVNVPEGAQYWDFEDNQPGFGPFVRGDASGTGDAQTSVSVLHYPYSQKVWKNKNIPFNSGDLAGAATDDVLEGAHSLKVHNESLGWVFRTVPARVNFEEGHKYRVSFSYQATSDNVYEWVLGRNQVGSTANDALSVYSVPQTLETTRFEQEFVAGCGENFVGLRTIQSTDADFTIDQFLVEDLGVTDEPATCASATGSVQDGLNTGVANRITTQFTNLGSKAVTNVGMVLGFEDGNVPEGWVIETEAEDGNLFQSVAPGQTVTTNWLVYVPVAATLGPIEFSVTADYAEDCIDNSVRNSFWGTVVDSDNTMIPSSQMTATASSSQPGEGPGNALVPDSSLWHSDWNGTTLPGWFQFNLTDPLEVDGVGYLPRQEGVNGKLKDYTIEVSDNGTDWTQVASGTWAQTGSELQVATFDPVEATFVRMNVLSVYGGDSTGTVFMSAQRMALFGTPDTPEPGFAPGQRPETDPNDCEVPDDGAVSITGTPVVGQQLQAVLEGVEDPEGATYSWLVSDSEGGPFEAISGQGDSLLLTDETLGKFVKVEASLGGQTYTSDPVGPVLAAEGASVAITGTPAIGEELTANVFGWDDLSQVTYQWFASDSVDGELTSIEGATEAGLLLGQDQVGRFVTVQATLGEETVTATPVGPVTGLPAASITIDGETKVGQTLTAVIDGWDSLDGVSYTWYLQPGAERASGTVVGTDAPTLKLTNEMVGKYVSVVATRGSGDDQETLVSAIVGPVVKAGAGNGGGLPVTGAQIALFTAVAALLLAAGGAFIYRSRRKL